MKHLTAVQVIRASCFLKPDCNQLIFQILTVKAVSEHEKRFSTKEAQTQDMKIRIQIHKHKTCETKQQNPEIYKPVKAKQIMQK